MAKRLLINNRDFTDYLTRTGYSVGYSSVGGKNSGIMLDGSYTEDELAVKAVVSLPCMPLNEAQLSAILTEVMRDTYTTVTYFDPRAGAERTITVRRSVSTQQYRGNGSDGLEYWTGTVITLTEK